MATTTRNHAWTRRSTELRPHAEQLRLWADPRQSKVVPAARRSGKTEIAKRKRVESLFRRTWHGFPPRLFAAAANDWRCLQVQGEAGRTADVGQLRRR